MSHLPAIAEAARLIRQRVLDPVDLVDQCLERIRQREAEVRAWVLVDADAARREAEQLGGLLRAGVDLGPLHGIPVGVKDIIDVRGLPTEAGSPLLRGCVAEEDAAVVSRLRAAGAIILGKTVTTEFAFVDPPPTRNPWNVAHTPGGSSSGSAAAVACGMCPAALGSQTAGSIIRPASFCGVAGLKPSFGRVSTAGVVPISPHLDHVGVLARSASDLAVVFGAVSASMNSALAFQPLDRPPPLARIDDGFWSEADESVREVTLAAYERLRAAGADGALLPLPASFAGVPAALRCIMTVEAAVSHERLFAQQADQYSPRIRALIEEGLATPAVRYAAALNQQQVFRREMDARLGDATVAMMPSTVTAAPAGDATTGDPRFNVPWSHAGLPVVTIPCGLTPAGLPCGLQLVGPRDQDEYLLAVAAWCERHVPWGGRAVGS